MAVRLGIDTSILVRLLTGDPAESYEQCVHKLTRLIERDDAEISASNQVIGEAYIALQHHYGTPKSEARAALLDVLKSGLVTPLKGPGVYVSLEADSGCGLVDRLIADDYRRTGLVTLTLDRKMAVLKDVRKL